jgi:hypothetical protein
VQGRSSNIINIAVRPQHRTATEALTHLQLHHLHLQLLDLALLRHCCCAAGWRCGAAAAAGQLLQGRMLLPQLVCEHVHSCQHLLALLQGGNGLWNQDRVVVEVHQGSRAAQGELDNKESKQGEADVGTQRQCVVI